MDKDHLVEPEDVITDAIIESVNILPFGNDFEVDPVKFLEEINSRSERVRIDLAFEILGIKSREEYERMMHKLHLKVT